MTGAVIIGAGARTPLGYSRSASVAAVRSGISMITEHPFMIDRFGERMNVTRDPGLDIGLSGPARLSAMAVEAAREAIQPILATDIKPSVGIAFSTGEVRPGQPSSLAGYVAEQLQSAVSEDGSVTHMSHNMGGHAGGAVALQTALDLLASGEIDVALVGGVDSYLDVETLEWLDANEQLHSERNIYGFCPGEAAGFMAISSSDMLARTGLRAILNLYGVGLGQEKNVIKTEDIVLGDGLAKAFAGAVTSLPTDIQIDRVICDMNGERYRGNEYGFAVLKTSGLFRDAADFEAPADCWGDVGAASIPLYAVMAVEAEMRGYSQGRLSMIWASSEAGLRGAVALGSTGAK